MMPRIERCIEYIDTIEYCLNYYFTSYKKKVTYKVIVGKVTYRCHNLLQAIKVWLKQLFWNL